MERKQKSQVWSARPKRVDRWIRERFPAMTRRHVQEAIEAGWIFFHDEEGGEHKMKKGDRVPPNNFLDCDQLEAHINTLWAGNPDLKLEILHKSQDYVVVDKPAGMHGHPLSLFDTQTVTHWALAKFDRIVSEFKNELQPTITPHRLDHGTSGCLVVCLSKAAFDQWREVFSEKKVTKKYLAWCWGTPNESRFSSNEEIAHHPSDDSLMVCTSSGEFREPKFSAQTQFKVLRQEEGYFLCEAETQTGVTHQVRVHLANLGFPLIGDHQYDRDAENRPFKRPHALLRAIEIKHPAVTIKAPEKPFIDKP